MEEVMGRRMETETGGRVRRPFSFFPSGESNRLCFLSFWQEKKCGRAPTDLSIRFFLFFLFWFRVRFRHAGSAADPSVVSVGIFRRGFGTHLLGVSALVGVVLDGSLAVSLLDLGRISRLAHAEDVVKLVGIALWTGGFGRRRGSGEIAG